MSETIEDSKINESSEIIIKLLTVEEEKQAECLRTMPRVGKSYEELLKKLELYMTAAIDHVIVDLEKKGHYISQEAYDFLLMIPFLAYRIEKQIESNQGPVCCTDKTFLILSNRLNEILWTNLSSDIHPDLKDGVLQRI